MKCPKCGGKNIKELESNTQWYQFYQCKSCNYEWREGEGSPFRG